MHSVFENRVVRSRKPLVDPRLKEAVPGILRHTLIGAALALSLFAICAPAQEPETAPQSEQQEQTLQQGGPDTTPASCIPVPTWPRIASRT
jgi:hypothetical protein